VHKTVYLIIKNEQNYILFNTKIILPFIFISNSFHFELLSHIKCTTKPQKSKTGKSFACPKYAEFMYVNKYFKSRRKPSYFSFQQI
jgi:hypothetical protein